MHTQRELTANRKQQNEHLLQINVLKKSMQIH